MRPILLAGRLPKGEPLIAPAMFRACLAEAACRLAAGQSEVFEGQS